MGLFSKIKRSVSRVSRTVSKAGSSISSAVSNTVGSVRSAVGSIGSNIGGFANTVLSGVDSFNDWENIAMGALNGIARGDVTGFVAGVGSAIAGNALSERQEKKAKKEEQRAIAEMNVIQREMDKKTNAYNKAAAQYNDAAAQYNDATKKFESAVVNSVRSSSSRGVGSVKDSWKVIYNQFTEKLKSSIFVNNGMSFDSSVFNIFGLGGSSVSSAVDTSNAK